MFPERLSIDDVANINLFQLKEIDNLSLEEKEEYIRNLKEAIGDLKEEIAFVEMTME